MEAKAQAHKLRRPLVIGFKIMSLKEVGNFVKKGLEYLGPILQDLPIMGILVSSDK